MQISTNVIKALAVGDMVDWITQFSTERDFKNYDDEAQEKYWEYIKRFQKKILREL